MDSLHFFFKLYASRRYWLKARVTGSIISGFNYTQNYLMLMFRRLKLDLRLDFSLLYIWQRKQKVQWCREPLMQEKRLKISVLSEFSFFEINSVLPESIPENFSFLLEIKDQKVNSSQTYFEVFLLERDQFFSPVQIYSDNLKYITV